MDFLVKESHLTILKATIITEKSNFLHRWFCFIFFLLFYARKEGKLYRCLVVFECENCNAITDDNFMGKKSVRSLVAELAERSPIIIQNCSSNPSSQKNLDL